MTWLIVVGPKKHCYMDTNILLNMFHDPNKTLRYMQELYYPSRILEIIY